MKVVIIMKLYHNGPILTMEEEMPLAEVLVEENGRILYVGGQAGAAAYADDAELVDLAGRTLMPAFLDAHSHISETAMLLSAANLQEARSFADLVAILKDYAAQPEVAAMPFVVGLGYDHNALEEQRHPDKFLLDAAFPDRAVVVVHTSMHMCVANSRMLAEMGVDAVTPTPEGGAIGRVGDSQEPDGYLEETAFNPVYDRVCKLLAATPERIANTQYHYIQHGILTIQEGATDAPIVSACRQAAEAGRLVCDVVAYPALNFGRGVGTAFEENANCLGRYKNHFKLGGYKLILDGSPQGRTAWLSTPYEDSDDCSMGWLSDEALQDYVDQCMRLRRQVLAHCNGDAAAEQFINACERALEKYPWEDARPVMIHCQTVRDDQLERMAKIGMIASFFVEHVYFWGDAHLKNLGPVRGPHISPTKAALERGVAFNLHTDCPVVPPDMFHTAWTACNRITKSGRVLGADQCLDVWQALKGLTIDAAYAYFEENDKGSLKAGKKADLILVDRNPLAIEVMQLKDIRVLACIKEGQLVYGSC